MTPRAETPDGPQPGVASPDVLLHGELAVVGRLRAASNATYLCEARLGGDALACVYKPVAGEAPLWDFPDGTLAGREVGAYLVSAALGWDVIPRTVLRDGPAGPGMVQRWIEGPDEGSGADLVDLFAPDRVPPGYLAVLRAHDERGEEVTLVHADDDRLRRMAVLDLLLNNADRKGGHVLAGADGGVYGVDHGLTLHAEDKLRTVLWGWAGRAIDDALLADVAALPAALDGSLGAELAGHITAEEVRALGMRARAVLDHPVMPRPDRRRPLPWPAF